MSIICRESCALPSRVSEIVVKIESIINPSGSSVVCIYYRPHVVLQKYYWFHFGLICCTQILSAFPITTSGSR
jgi:hypothetical protein